MLMGTALAVIGRCVCQGTLVWLHCRVVPPMCSCPCLDDLLCVDTLHRTATISICMRDMLYVGLVRCRSFCGAPGAPTAPSLVSAHVHFNQESLRVYIISITEEEGWR